MPGFAASFHKVPANAFTTPTALSVVSVTTVPAGDVSVTSRSSLKVCGSIVYTFRSTRNGCTPDTTVCDDTTAGPVGTVTGVVLSNDVVWVGIAAGSAVRASDHPFRLPTLPGVSSKTVSVQVPFGFSPRKRSSGSSGTSVLATTPLTYARSVTRPSLVSYGTCPPGFAWSFHTVPLKTLAMPSPLSVVSVTTVPEGETMVTSRSPLFGCWRKVVTSTSRR